MALLALLNENRLTEYGAEAVALAYVNGHAGWIVERRLQRGESGDWLLSSQTGELAVEVSGMAYGDPAVRLAEKRRQVSRCTLRARLLAVVVAFDGPFIMAASA